MNIDLKNDLKLTTKNTMLNLSQMGTQEVKKRISSELPFEQFMADFIYRHFEKNLADAAVDYILAISSLDKVNRHVAGQIWRY